MKLQGKKICKTARGMFLNQLLGFFFLKHLCRSLKNDTGVLLGFSEQDKTYSFIVQGTIKYCPCPHIDNKMKQTNQSLKNSSEKVDLPVMTWLKSSWVLDVDSAGSLEMLQ